MFIIDFSPPMSGFEGEFNTVRLGMKLFKVLKVGDIVGLVDKPKSTLFGRAIVENVVMGKLGDLAQLHAQFNHNQLGLDVEGAPKRLIENMIKRYGPHICDVQKKVSIIYLKRLE